MQENLFKWKHFEKDIILLCVRWYLKFPLSYRMLQEMMSERGICVAPSTIMRWAHEYSPILEERARKHLKKTNDSWRMDETYLKIKGKNCYLYRAVDSNGRTIDFYVSENRDKKSAKKFFKKAIKSSHNQKPRVITVDKYSATEIAIYELIYSGDLPCTVGIRKTKYLNNIIEQDHRFIKRKIRTMLGFKSLESAKKTICGIEIMHMIKKGQIEVIQDVLLEVEFINKIMGEVA
jgi:IS6 family transposase